VLIACLVIIIIWAIKFWQIRREGIEYRAKFPSAIYCLDGDKVKSLSERLIDDCLTRYGIQHHYEDYIKKTEGKYKYDWYLPDAEIYLEFFGLSTRAYQEKRKLKEKIYKRNNMLMIPIEPMDLDRLEEKLQLKFGKKIWSQIAHSKHCPECGRELDHRLL
jgi:hypothetical protein